MIVIIRASEILRGNGGFPLTSLSSELGVGWVERSETQHLLGGIKKLGFATLNPTYNCFQAMQ